MNYLRVEVEVEGGMNNHPILRKGRKVGSGGFISQETTILAGKEVEGSL